MGDRGGSITLTDVVGGYAEETDGIRSWMWTNDRLEFRFLRPVDRVASFSVRFACEPAAPGRQLTVSLVDPETRVLKTVDLKEGWNPIVCGPFEVARTGFSLVLYSEQPPLPVSPNDARLFKFRVKDLEVSGDDMPTSSLDGMLRKLVCPVCLGTLAASKKEGGSLVCSSCAGVFLTESGLPIMLLDDENRLIKTDEIRGEAEYNVKVVPPEVHETRNAFVDRNTDLFLSEVGISLEGKELLAVGASMAEFLLCARHGAKPFCLDIVPSLTLGSHRATVATGLDARWVCGDGECLPFDDESFDVVMVRQALHHMLKYYSAIAEFFRVLRTGGVVLIVDEPFSALDPGDSLLRYPGGYQLYGGLEITEVREVLGIASPRTADTVASDLVGLETAPTYIAVDDSDPERLLADKYHAFSVLNCISALKMHTGAYDLFWPKEVGWSDEGGPVIQFRSGPSPLYGQPLLKRLVSQGNVSIVARKEQRTRVFRDRRGIRPMPVDLVRTMLQSG